MAVSRQEVCKLCLVYSGVTPVLFAIKLLKLPKSIRLLRGLKVENERLI